MVPNIRVDRGRRLPSAAALALAILLPSAARARDEPEHAVVRNFERFFTTFAADAREGGEVLLGELGCINCHSVRPDVRARIEAREGPVLAGAGDRLQASAFLDTLSDPHAAKPGTTMPDVLAGLPAEERRDAERALTHFLASQRGATLRSAPDASPERGRRLFETVGCVACHDPTDDAPRAPKPSAPLGELDGKYTFAGLADFLHDPLAVRPQGRMPSFGLSIAEASDVAAHLLGRSVDRAAPFRVDPERAREGERLFGELGCASCHRLSLESRRAPPPAPPLEDVRPEDGCLSEEPLERPGRFPRYRLSRLQRLALRMAISEIDLPWALEPGRAVARAMTTHDCFACHTRRDAGGPDAASAPYFVSRAAWTFGEESRLPPRLDLTGEKLREEAIREALRGRGAVRPYLATRMPDFGPALAERLPALFAAADRPKVATDDDDPESPKVPLRIDLRGSAARGRALVGLTGLGCVSCHDLYGARSRGLAGVDLGAVAQRMRPEWFARFLSDPTGLAHGTRMPRYWTEGEGAQDIGGIWTYLIESRGERLPAGMDGAPLATDALSRPLVVEAREAGSERPLVAVAFPAIDGAAGAPHAVHAAFDPARGGWTLVWRGTFAARGGAATATPEDASSVAPPAAAIVVPGDDDVMRFPSGPSVALLASATAPWPRDGGVAGLRFDGWELDGVGVPVFHTLLEVATRGDIGAARGGPASPVRVRERLAPLDGGVVVRAVKIEGLAGDARARPSLRVWTAERIDPIGDGLWLADGAVRLAVIGAPARVRRAATGLELIADLTAREGVARVEVRVAW